MQTSDIIEIISIIANLITSIIAIVISILTLKQASKAVIESSRADIVFYVDTLTGDQQFLTIKNFGKSVGRILSLKIAPELDYSKSTQMHNDSNPVLPDYANILLAPNQCIKSWFPFSYYPDKHFDVYIKYKTLGKTYEYNYPIDLSYIEAIDYLYKNPLDIKNENDALVYIGNTIKRFSEKYW